MCVHWFLIQFLKCDETIKLIFIIIIMLGMKDGFRSLWIQQWITLKDNQTVLLYGVPYSDQYNT